MSGVKSRGLTPELRPKLLDSSLGEDSGIPSVAVKCVDIWEKANGEGSFLASD